MKTEYLVLGPEISSQRKQGLQIPWLAWTGYVWTQLPNTVNVHSCWSFYLQKGGSKQSQSIPAPGYWSWRWSWTWNMCPSKLGYTLHRHRNIFLVILRDLIFKACSLGLEHNTQQQVVVLVMLINSSYFPDWISFSYVLVCSNCLWHQSSSAMQWRIKEWNRCPLRALHPWGMWGRWRPPSVNISTWQGKCRQRVGGSTCSHPFPESLFCPDVWNLCLVFLKDMLSCL